MDERPKNARGWSYYLTREFRAPIHCIECQRGTCVQRVEYRDDLPDMVRVTHGVRQLS